MAGRSQPIPVIDLFAGPGGLGEGFSSCRLVSGESAYRRVLSIEMEPNAHATLQLRSFFHKFPKGAAPDAYYERVRGRITTEELFDAFPDEARMAKEEAWCAELGKVDPDTLHGRISEVVSVGSEWVLCGGPPCQAYSVVGRSRRGGIDHKDARVYLYREYLNILARHQPAIFIMENVKGLLSSQVRGNGIFRQILQDLSAPGDAVTAKNRGSRYRILSLVVDPTEGDTAGNPIFEPSDFIIRCEEYGIPQARHRVILLGVREDLWHRRIPVLKPFGHPVATASVLRDLPRLRSGLTRIADGPETWLDALEGILTSDVLKSLRRNAPVREAIIAALASSRQNIGDRGGEFVPWTGVVRQPENFADWYVDPRIGGFLNHASRPHMAADLCRYLYAASYASIMGRSPDLRDFPRTLLPLHRNVTINGKEEYFDDRFRVQLGARPATTITCHIAKDGHYYIHYDPTQCRSLTVREAARLQTFPDNYFFCGTRTAQYRQVGNAVPPLLAIKIATAISEVCVDRDSLSDEGPVKDDLKSTETEDSAMCAER